MRCVHLLAAGATAVLALFALETLAHAQIRGPGGGRPPPSGPTQSGPTQNRPVGPRGGAGDDDDPGRIGVSQRAEPNALPPQDPLAISPEVRARIGSDWDAKEPSPRQDADVLHRQYVPYFEERRGDYRFRMLPPFWFEHTRGLVDPSSPRLAGIPATPDRESLYGLFYYQRRSKDFDADVLFPAFWNIRDKQTTATVVGPFVHREAPGEHDNWLAPLFFSGSRADGGYFHAPALLTTSHWNAKGAFTLAGPYYRDRTGTDVDTGVVPFYFHGDNGNMDGAHKSFTLIPPLLYYHREREIDESQSTIIGPVIMESNPKRAIFDIAPFIFHIQGRPATGGKREEHTTVFPFFHYGYTPEQSLFVTPVYMRRLTRSADTLITPLFTHATTRNGATSLTAVGPVLPLFFDYQDRDIGLHATGLAPLFYTSDSPLGHDLLTPLFGKFETYGVSKTYWAFPTITVTTDTTGWTANLHPLIYVGRSNDSSHTVLAPIFWDFASPTKRTTVGFPLFWRFSDTTDDSVTQVAANTVYLQKRVAGGRSWQFHLVPLFSYGENPEGYFWNVLFGLAGYERAGSYGRAKAFWVPFQVSGPSGGPPPATPGRAARAPDTAPGAF